MAPYHPVGFEAGVDAATKGLSNVDVLGSLMQDLNQAAAAAVVVSLLALKSIFGRSSGVPGVSHVVVSSVLDSSSSSLEAVRSKFMYIKSLDPPLSRCKGQSPECSAKGMGQFPICKMKWDLLRTSITACVIDKNTFSAPFGIFYMRTEI